MCSILELMPRCNEFGMHEILVSDPNGTSHLDASVWKNEEEPEEEEEKTVGLRLSSLMRSSVEDTLNEAQFKEQIAKQEAYRQSKKNEGVNKFTMLKLPENKIWRLSELTHEEYRLYSVGVGWETHG